MVATKGDYRPLLSGGQWLAGSAAIVAILYAIGGGSSIAAALAFEYLLVAIAAWSARQLVQKRSRLARSAADASSNVENGEGLTSAQSDSLNSAVQSHTAVLGGGAIAIGLFAILQLLQLTPGEPRVADDDMVIGLVCLAGVFVWLVVARSFQSISTTDLPESSALMLAFREAQWSTLIAAAGLLGSPVEPLLLFWVTQLLLVWVIVVCVETILRWLAAIVIPAEPSQENVSPIQLLSREAIFAASNPVSSLVQTFENRCGVSVRSSWAISFVRNATFPLLVFLLLLCWGLTSFAIVETHQMAVREQFGRVVGGPLTPGLQIMLPWPFGRIRSFPVKTVQQLPIGFVEADEASQQNQPRALLWTKPHAKEEFALALGDGSELVAVNALVYFKISEVPDEFLDYVYQQSSPEEALTAFAYRALMEETRGRTLDDVLSVNRAAFARRIADSVREQAKAARLGLEVVDFALLNLHPPIEAGGEYLEVINARLDARRRVTEAEGEKDVALLDSKMRGTTAVAAARVNSSRRVAGVLGEVAEFKAVGEAFQSSPRTFRVRLWIEAIETALANQRLLLVDHSLMDDGGLTLDARRQEIRRPPELDAPSPYPLPGPNQDD